VEKHLEADGVDLQSFIFHRQFFGLNSKFNIQN
jgi:hypothetical protein